MEEMAVMLGDMRYERGYWAFVVQESEHGAKQAVQK